jgi:undecaprenyl-diphosphatase
VEGVSSTERHGGQRTRVAVALIAGLALVWVLRLVSAWADHTVAFITFVVVAAALVLLVDWLVASFGPGVWRFVRSVATSLGRAVRDDAEVTALVGRHPKVFGFLGRRFSRERPSGLYLTLTAASALYFFSSFVSTALSLALSRAITDYDPQISALLRAFRTPTVTRLLWGATILADPRVIPLLAIAAALLLVMWGRRAEAGLLVVTLSGGLLLQEVTKLVFSRPRPPVAFSLITEPSSFSFPSGHAFSSLLFAGVIVFVLWRALPGLRARLATLFVAALCVGAVGLSRVYLGVHWASDVIASWSLALAWLSVTCGCYLMLTRYRHMREAWPAWSSRKVRTVTTLVVSFLAIVAVAAGAQADPLLAQATAATPSRPWIVTIDSAGLPSPTPTELQQLPLFSEKLDGSRQDPIGIVFVGTRAQLTSAFAAAGWQTADPPSLGSLTQAVLAALTNQPYPTAPVTPTFLDGAVQDIAFEKPEGAATVRRRHHARFWLTSATLGGVPVWVATASFDSRLEIGTTIPLPTHHVEPDIDAEQAYVVADLIRTGQAALVVRVQVTQPTTGTNAQGDAWFTQGYASMLEAKP